MKKAFCALWISLVCSAAGAKPLDPVALNDPELFAGVDVVVLGELHDNPSHHDHQARAVATLGPKAMVFEMLPPGVKMPDAYAGSQDLAQALEWEARGWPDFAMYYPIFSAAPTARIYGAEVSREVARRAFDTGLPAAFGADAAAYGLTTALTAAAQSAREAEQAEAHCNALPADLLPAMVDVQRLRDATLAKAVVKALADTGGPVAVITGSGHARKDAGVPSILAQVAPALRVLSVGQFEADPGPDAPYDLWLVSDPPLREDPCKDITGG